MRMALPGIMPQGSELSQRMMDTFKTDNNPWSAFLTEAVDEIAESTVEKEELVSAFRAFCNKHSFNFDKIGGRDGQVMFRKIYQLRPAVKPCQVRPPGEKRKEAVKGLRLKPEYQYAGQMFKKMYLGTDSCDNWDEWAA